jgi:hypothetical protein
LGNVGTSIFAFWTPLGKSGDSTVVFDAEERREYSWGFFRCATPDSEENNMARRSFFAQLASLPFLALRTKAEESKKPLKIMMKSAWGSDDPTRASFAFVHGLALADAGHEVRIFLTGEATYLMRKATADAIMPVGWPPLSETREKVVAKHIPVFS